MATQGSLPLSRHFKGPSRRRFLKRDSGSQIDPAFRLALHRAA